MTVTKKRKPISNKREIQVILQNKPFSTKVAYSFVEYIRRSKQLAFVFLLLKENPHRDKAELLERILAVKGLQKNKDQGFRENIHKGLQVASHWFILLDIVRRYKATKVDSTKHEYKQALEQLWTLLVDDNNADSSVTNWTELGFQGKDPSTDFRGAGWLSLLQLTYFVKTRLSLCRKLVYNSKTYQPSYPFACTGINCTEVICKLLEEGILLPNIIENVSSEQIEQQLLEHFHFQYISFFVLFHETWRKGKPQNLLDFGTFMNRATTIARDKLLEHGTILSIEELNTAEHSIQ
eukprot:jgi/Galph1/1984/GphlegSOOS_G657.1